MNSPNFDNSSDNDWDGGRGELEWTERHWKLFLQDADAEVTRFLKIYQSLHDSSQRLDKTAQVMGWDSEEWSNDYDLSDEARIDWISIDLEADDEEDEEEMDDIEDNDPYTIHKHPLYVTTRSLFLILNHHWQVMLSEFVNSTEVMDSFRFAEGLRKGETNAIMGIHALEMGDYNLVVCHLQRALDGLNASFGIFQGVVNESDEEIGPHFKQEVAAACFDLRELWLRVIRECRSNQQSR